MTISVLTPAETRHQQLVQLGILVASLGGVLSLISLYPSITGVEPKSGIGLLQILILLFSMSLIVFGLWLFIKVAFYPTTSTNLAQRIAIRLSMTGLLFAAALGMSDILGYGSNPPGGETSFPILGIYQVLGMLFGFLMGCTGVLIFWVAGPKQRHPDTDISLTLPKGDPLRTTALAEIIGPDILEKYRQEAQPFIRQITVADASAFLELLRRLDGETAYMLLEADERSTTLEEQTQRLSDLRTHDRAALFVVEHDSQLIGFLSAEGGQYRRNRHSAYVVMGIVQQYTQQGIGTRLFDAVEAWAKRKQITRMELTVMSHNAAAIALYKKVGFLVEGTKRHSLQIEGQYVNELYMGKLLDGLY
jgi:RimJ/RimL family protein N-acetyltransferase